MSPQDVIETTLYIIQFLKTTPIETLTTYSTFLIALSVFIRAISDLIDKVKE